MDRRIVFALMISALFSAFLFAGCNQQSGGTATLASNDTASLVPNKASTYMVVDIKSIIADSALKEAMLGSAQDIDTQLAEFKNNAGVEANQVDRSIVFADETGTYGGMIVSAKYDKSAAIASIKETAQKRGPVNESEFEGVSILEMKDSKGNDTAVAFVTDNAIVFGTIGSVQDVVLVSKGKLGSFADSSASAAVKKVDSNGVLLVVTKITDKTRELSGGQASSVTAMAMSLAKNGANFDMKMAMVFGSADEASAAKDQMDQLIAYSATTAANDSQSRVVSKMKASSEGDVLITTLNIDAEDLKALKSTGANPLVGTG